MVHAISKKTKVTQCLTKKKEGEPTQIDSPKVTQNDAHANKQSKCITNVSQNYGFDKCESFSEAAVLALYRALEINNSGEAQVNIYVNGPKQEISAFFYTKTDFNDSHLLFANKTTKDLYQFNLAFLRYENYNKEACHD